MQTRLTRAVTLLSFLLLFFVFKNSTVFAAEMKVVTIEKGKTVEELEITENTIINADSSVVIPKLTVKDGAEVVEINAAVQTLEVIAQNNVELTGEGDITKVIISTDKNVGVNTNGDINQLEITNKDARLVVKEGTKVATLIIPQGTLRTDIITNYEHCKHRFENDGNDEGESTPVDEKTPPADETTPPADETTPPADETTPPADETTPPSDEKTPPADDNSTPSKGTGVTATVSITQGNDSKSTKATGTIGGITFKAKDAGSAGNSIVITQHDKGGISNPTNINVWNSNISISLSTVGGTCSPPSDMGPGLCNATATNDSVKLSVENNTQSSNLVDVAITGNGDDLAIGGSVTLSGGTDGVTEKLEMTITHGADVAGTVTVTVNDTPFVVDVAAGDNSNIVASKIATELNGNVDNYNVVASSNVVTFTSTISGNVEDLSVTFE